MITEDELGAPRFDETADMIDNRRTVRATVRQITVRQLTVRQINDEHQPSVVGVTPIDGTPMTQ